MAIFNRGKAGMKRPIIEVIAYNGPNDVLIWKHPNENFNTNTQLIVGPAQEAIFVKGGQVLERFISGTYTLNTENYPFIRALVGLVTGGVSPFSCSVYYVNKVVLMGIDWGTDTPISIMDPVYGIPVDVRGYGDFSLRVEDGRKLMEKLVGQSQGFSQHEVQQFFSKLMATQVRSLISSTMQDNGLSPIGIDAHLAEMSLDAAKRIQPIFEPYGMAVNHFTIANISAADLDEMKRKSRDLQKHRMETEVSVEDKRKMAQAQAYANSQLNVTEQQKMVGRAMEALASNTGPIAGGAEFMPFVGMDGGNVSQPSSAGTAEIARMLLDSTAQSGAVRSNTNDEDAPQSQKDFEQRVAKVKFMLDSGVITQEQFQEKIDQLLREV